METVPVTSSHAKKLEVTDMKMCRWACGHMLRVHVRNDNIRERLKVENITKRCRKARLRWFGHVKRRPRLCWEKDSGDGTTSEKKARKTEGSFRVKSPKITENLNPTVSDFNATWYTCCLGTHSTKSTILGQSDQWCGRYGSPNFESFGGETGAVANL